MYSLGYPAPMIGTILSHFPLVQPLLRDGSQGAADSDDLSELHIRARVSSGDYFATLATELDKLAQGLSAVQAPEAPELERIVSELLYVDRNYHVIKK